MAGNGGGKLPPDPRLVFVANPYHGRSGSKRSILSTDIVEYEPVVRARDWPELIEFSIKPDRPWLCGPMTKFQVTGKFVRERYIAAVAPVQQVGEEGDVDFVAAAPGVPERWEPQDTVPEDRAQLLLGQNWWELLVKQFTIYHKNINMKTTNELPSMQPFLNSLLYVMMDERAKVNLGQVQCHPIFALDPARGSYGTGGAGDTFIDYSRQVYGREFSFNWIPMHTFPFWQSTKFPVDEYASNIVPFHYTKHGVDIQLLLHRDQAVMYKQNATLDRLRFELTDFRLIVEEATLSPQIEKALFSRGKVLKYQGVTKNATAENVQAGVMSHKVKFSDVYFPEGVFIFAVPKKVVAGTYQYNDNTNPLRSLVADHHIQLVKVAFGGKELYHKEPHNGQLMNPLMCFKRFLDYTYSPPFGLKMEPTYVEPEKLVGGCNDTSYPHVYINLRNTKDGERVAPVHEDGSITALKKDLEIQLIFDAVGATANVSYLVYTWYSDTYMEMHLLADRDAVFINNYMEKM
jgi:hypothetical protein